MGKVQAKAIKTPKKITLAMIPPTQALKNLFIEDEEKANRNELTLDKAHEAKRPMAT